MCLALGLTLTQVACSKSPDAEVLTATLNHLYANGTDLGTFAPDSILLLHPLSKAWKDEDLRSLRLSSATGGCHFSADVYDGVATRNAASVDVSKLISPQDGWRFGSEAELATRQNALSPNTTSGVMIFSFGTVSLPTYSEDSKTAYALIAFTWDLHTMYGEYTLTSAQDGWHVQCREFLMPYF